MGLTESPHKTPQQPSLFDVQIQENGAALHLAAENGHLKVAELLIKKRADVHAKDKVGE